MDVKKLSGVELFWESQYEQKSLYQRSSGLRLIDEASQKVIAKIPRQTFATLALVFGINSFAISESGGPLSCYGSKDGALLWKIQPATGVHFLALSYHASMDRYLGVTWPYIKGGNKKLKVIHPFNGNVERELDLNCPAETEFALNGNVLITSERVMVDTNTLKVSHF